MYAVIFAMLNLSKDWGDTGGCLWGALDWAHGVLWPLQCDAFQHHGQRKAPVLSVYQRQGRSLASVPFDLRGFEWSSLPYQPDICIRLNEVCIKCQHDFNANAWYWRGFCGIAVCFPSYCFFYELWCISPPFSSCHNVSLESETAFSLWQSAVSLMDPI